MQHVLLDLKIPVQYRLFARRNVTFQPSFHQKETEKGSGQSSKLSTIYRNT